MPGIWVAAGLSDRRTIFSHDKKIVAAGLLFLSIVSLAAQKKESPYQSFGIIPPNAEIDELALCSQDLKSDLQVMPSRS